MADIAIPDGFRMEAEPQAAAQNTPAIPDGFVLEGQPSGRGVIDKLTGATGERFQTWPERLVRGIAGAVESGFTLPGDVLNQKASPNDTGRVLDLATMGLGVSPAIRSGGTVIPAGRAVPEAPPQSGRMSITVNPLRQNFEPVLPAQSEGQQVAAAANRIGVDLPKAAASDNMVVQQGGKILASNPLIGGQLRNASENAVAQIGEATGRAAEMAGGSSSPEMAGNTARTALENYIGPVTSGRQKTLYDRVDSLIDPNKGTVPSATRDTIAGIVARRQQAGFDNNGQAVDLVNGLVLKPNGATYEGIKTARTRVGELINGGPLPGDISQGELKQIYGALTQDLKTAVQNSGGEQASKAFERANKYTQLVSDRRESLNKILGPATRSDEGIAATITRLAGSNSSADAKLLVQARRSMSSEDWKDIASSAIDQLGRNRAGEFSPTKFASDFSKLSETGRQTLFNATGDNKVLPYLRDIAKVSERFKQLNKFANPSGTAGHTITAALGGLALNEPITAISSIIGGRVISRALSQPATAASMARWSRAYLNAAAKPGASTIAQLQSATQNLTNTFNSTLGGNLNPSDFLRRLQSPVSVPADDGQSGGKPQN